MKDALVLGLSGGDDGRGGGPFGGADWLVLVLVALLATYMGVMLIRSRRKRKPR